IGNIFTGAVRTTGRAEGENRINKIIGGPKKTFLQFFEGLNQRSQGQSTKELPLKMLLDYAGPFAFQTCYKQMQLSLFYINARMRPNPGQVGLLKQMLNVFENDKAHISVKWLLQLVTKRGLWVRHLLVVRHTSRGASHYAVILSDGRYIYDCCMPANLGIPCRHYFRLWVDFKTYPSISL
ncbi:hypothetical protein B0H14DRAFT_2358320, partial [Mycena olivaceomarginata]